jgi:hypothetical protein
MTLDIDVRHDRVTIAGTMISRPSSLAPSQWLAIWEHLTAYLEKKK